jgi:aminoglycoside phosphotransferase (APT) family kinase protein
VEPLLVFLRERFGPGVGYASPPRHLADGVTARAFALRLKGAPGEMSGELVCRLFDPGPTSTPPDQFPIEEALHNALAQHGYPVPRVFAACGSGSPLGAPFMLMERVAGHGVFLWGVVALVAGLALGLSVSWLPLVLFLLCYWGFMVRLLMRLHAVPGDAVLDHMEGEGIARDRLSLDSLLEILETQLGPGERTELRPLVDWLRSHRPEPMEPPTVCHGDFWLGNLLIGGRRATVLDWTQAAISHPEFDLGWISIQRYSRLPLELAISDRIYDLALSLVSPFTWLLFGANGLAYRLARGADPERLRYYNVFHCSRVLLRIAALRAAGAESGRPGSAELMAWGSPRTVRLLLRRIRRISGLVIDPQPVLPTMQ